MKILVINAGSSSLKYQLIDMTSHDVMAKGLCERIGIDGSNLQHTNVGKGTKTKIEKPMKDHGDAIQMVIDALVDGEIGVISSMDEIGAVGHRVVHGAEEFADSCIITEAVMKALEKCTPLAPLHNPPNIIGIEACTKIMPNVPQVAVFDTAFHQTMPPKAYMYALPYECYEQDRIRKYGFHGTSHRFVSAALAEAMGKDIKDLKIVSCHLGNGSSITAVDGGKSVDTSMGFTPLDGILMGTRCGAVDPSAVTYVMDKHGFDAHQMSEYMNKKSGILTSDMLQYQIKKYIGAYAAAMNGLDAVLFTGGIGENSWEVREAVCRDMEYFGIKIDYAYNKTIRGKLTKISTPDSKIEVWVVPTNEELLIARDTLAVIAENK